MLQRRKLLELLSEEMDLPGERIPGQPLVELAGGRSVLIENHQGITEYTREKIQVQVKFGQLCIGGACMELTKMTKEQVVITGRIDSVTLIRRN